jgi:hypothetical protein
MDTWMRSGEFVRGVEAPCSVVPAAMKSMISKYDEMATLLMTGPPLSIAQRIIGNAFNCVY